MSREELPCVNSPLGEAVVHIGKGQEAGEPALSEEERPILKRKSGPLGDAEDFFELSWEVSGL